MKDTKQRVMDALLDDQNQTLTAAARAAKVSRRTVYDYLNEKEFAEAYRHQRELQAIQRADLLEDKRQEAVWKLVDLMLDTTQPGAVRCKAASLLIAEANTAQAQVDAITKSRSFESDWF